MKLCWDVRHCEILIRRENNKVLEPALCLSDVICQTTTSFLLSAGNIKNDLKGPIKTL